MKMKRIGLIVLLFFFSVACEKADSDFNKDVSFDPVVEQIKIAGIEHNLGLEFVLEKLKGKMGHEEFPKFSRKNILDLSMEYTREFFMQNEVDFIAENREKVIDFAIEASEKTEVLLANKSDNGFSFFRFFEEESLSEKQVELLSVLNIAINTGESEINELLEVFDHIRIRAKEECEGNEKYVVLAAVEIGIHSMNYWYENLDYWVELLGDGSKSWFSWRKVGAYDIGGAIGGAAVAAITGAGIGAGIVGGAVGASVTCAVVQVIGHYVDLD
jgi:hypothetical protein